MRKIFFILTLIMALFIPQLLFASTSVSNIRWVTRNDASISYVRVVLDLTSPVKASATISKDGLSTEVILHNAKLNDSSQTIAMNPKIVKNAVFTQANNNVVITIKTPKSIEPSDMHIFSLKKGLQPDKPERLVIDIKETNVQPREFYYGKPRPSTVKNKRTMYKEKGPYRVGGGLKGKIIALDPGHGGTDPGSINQQDGTQEKNITLPVSLYLKDMLEDAGAKVVMTRTTDKDVFGPYASDVDELQARADVANNNKADIFISVHINSFTNPSVGGVSDYYYQKTPYDKKLAKLIQDQIGAQPNMVGDRGINEAGLYVLDHTLMPATLVELGFISNPKEVAELKKESVQKDFAKRMFNAIENYFRG